MTKHKKIYQSELIKTVISGSDGTVTLIVPILITILVNI